MMSYRCVMFLKSDDAKPFWDELDRIEKKYQAELRSKRDGNITFALDAIDEIRAIPRRLESAVKK